MSRARPFLVIAGALALFPAGFAAARIVVTAIVVPILCMVSDIGYRLPQTAGVPEPRLRLAGQYDLGSADAGADRHWYYLDTAREESPSSVCSLHNQARMVAAYTNGMLSGYRLTAIQPGSVWRRIGIENGDLIRRINGHTLERPEKFLEVWTKAWNERWIDIEVERDGRSVLNVVRLD